MTAEGQKLYVGQRVAKANAVPGWPDTIHIVRRVDVSVNLAPDGCDPMIAQLIEIEIAETGAAVFVLKDVLRPTHRHVESDVEQLPLFAAVPA